VASGDLYVVKDHQVGLGQTQVLNVYYYRQILGSENALVLAGRFEQLMLPAVINVQSDAITHHAIEVRNVDDPLDWANLTLTSLNQGMRGTVHMPPFVAWAFRYNRASLAVRHGQKRIGGVSEQDVDAGLASAGVSANLQALAAAMGANLATVGLENEWEPRIVRVTGVPGAYVYTDFPVNSVQYVRVSTQNTRKFGRGA